MCGVSRCVWRGSLRMQGTGCLRHPVPVFMPQRHYPRFFRDYSRFGVGFCSVLRNAGAGGRGVFRLPLFFCCRSGGRALRAAACGRFPPLRGPLAGSYFEGAVPLFQKGPQVKASFPPLLVTWAATWYNKAALLTKNTTKEEGGLNWLGHLRTVNRHRRLVRRACFQAGL